MQLMRRTMVSLSSVMLSAACSSAPEPPAEPQEVAALAAQYASPSATLEPSVMGAVLQQSVTTQAALEAVSGLRFVRDVVHDATSATADSTDFDLEVQGSAMAHAACPGWDDDPIERPDDGYIEVTIGVENSSVQRAFAGHATSCKFKAERAGQAANAIATMDLQFDLGSDLALGDEAVTGLLVRATNVSGTIDGVPLGLGAQVFSFRIAEDDAVETLIDLAPMQLGLSGTCLLALRTDGVWALKTRTGEWSCGSAGSGPCVLDPA
jgi:hypothetical protein